MAQAAMNETETIIAHVKSGGVDVPLTSRGVPVRFDTSAFTGTIAFTHQPPGEISRHGFSERPSDSKRHWEIQIQGRFKMEPCGELFCGGVLPDMPYGLNNLFKSTRVLAMKGLKLRKCPQSGSSLVCFPMLESDRLCRSLDPISLPAMYPEGQGSWDWIGDQWGEWLPVNWREARFDIHHHYLFSFSSKHVNWDLWKLTDMPGIGTLGLENLWRKQACSMQLFDEAGHCFVQLDFIPPDARETVKVSSLIEFCGDDLASTCTSPTTSDFDVGMECDWGGTYFDPEEDEEDLEGMEFVPNERSLDELELQSATF